MTLGNAMDWGQGNAMPLHYFLAVSMGKVLLLFEAVITPSDPVI